MSPSIICPPLSYVHLYHMSTSIICPPLSYVHLYHMSTSIICPPLHSLWVFVSLMLVLSQPDDDLQQTMSVTYVDLDSDVAKQLEEQYKLIMRSKWGLAADEKNSPRGELKNSLYTNVTL